MVNVKMLVFDVVVMVYVAIAIAVFVPWALLSTAGPTPLSVAISNDIYSFFSHFCSQIPWHSFFYNGIQAPVCARCTSIYIFTALGLVFFRFAGYGAREFKMNWLLLVLLLLPVGVDGTTQLLGWRESTNSLRLATGAFYGLGYAYFLAWALPAIYALLELMTAALDHNSDKANTVMKRLKYISWPFSTSTRS